MARQRPAQALNAFERVLASDPEHHDASFAAAQSLTALDRNEEASTLLAAMIGRDPGNALADRIIALMQRLKMPKGLFAVGYRRDDIPALVEGTMPQHRVTKLSPRPAGEKELGDLFDDAMVYW